MSASSWTEIEPQPGDLDADLAATTASTLRFTIAKG